MQERHQGNQASEFHPSGIGQIEVEITEVNSRLEVLSESNLLDPEFQEKIWSKLEKLMSPAFAEDIRNGIRVAFVELKKHRTLSIAVFSGTTAAAVIAYELGARHGEDVTKVIDFFKSKKDSGEEPKVSEEK